MTFYSTMASLLQYWLQKRKTVSQKTVKSLFQFFRKDLRLTKTSNFWSSVHAIVSRIEPKVSKVDPKNTKKRPIYEVKLFSATFCGIGALTMDNLYINYLININHNLQTFLNIALYSKNWFFKLIYLTKCLNLQLIFCFNTKNYSCVNRTLKHLIFAKHFLPHWVRNVR